MAGINLYHEHQILGRGPEAEESAYAASQCQKNPGHETFIPVNDVSEKHLPENLRHDTEVLKLIKITAKLTVRLKVRCTSSQRPDRDKYLTSPGGLRTGTGFIYHVDANNAQPCESFMGEGQAAENRKYWHLKVVTALHVVFDDEEASKTSADLFYDTTDGKMTTLRGGKVLFTSDDVSDRCRLSFLVSDASLGKMLEELHKDQMQLVYSLNNRYGSEGSTKLVWCASHPHGLPKHVTFGELVERKGLGKGFYQYVYSADTCSGTSGSAIWELGHIQSSAWTLLRLGIYHEDTMNQLLGPDPNDDLDSMKGAADCKKHPGHKTFIPISELTQGHLPQGYQNCEVLFEFIKVTADLTVRLRAWGANSNPQMDGKTNGSSNDGASRTATGMIWDVYAKDGACQCINCKDNPIGSEKYWECTVLTSKQALSDDSAPEKILIDLFYDSEESRKTGTMKTVHGDVDSSYNTEFYSRLWFATCDAALVTMLEDLSRRRNQLPDRLRERYISDKFCNVMWIVSHPHGLPKHVTFGETQEGQRLAARGYQYNTADVCPGCNGAYIWGLHYRRLSAPAPALVPHHSKAGGATACNVGCY